VGPCAILSRLIESDGDGQSGPYDGYRNREAMPGTRESGQGRDATETSDKNPVALIVGLGALILVRQEPDRLDQREADRVRRRSLGRPIDFSLMRSMTGGTGPSRK
jgi:hypothetical protein